MHRSRRLRYLFRASCIDWFPRLLLRQSYTLIAVLHDLVLARQRGRRMQSLRSERGNPLKVANLYRLSCGRLSLLPLGKVHQTMNSSSPTAIAPSSIKIHNPEPMKILSSLCAKTATPPDLGEFAGSIFLL